MVYDFYGKTLLESLDATDKIILFHNMEIETETLRNHMTPLLHS